MKKEKKREGIIEEWGKTLKRTKEKNILRVRHGFILEWKTKQSNRENAMKKTRNKERNKIIKNERKNKCKT